MKTHTFSIFAAMFSVAGLFAGSGAFAADATTGLSKQDRSFMLKAAEASTNEVSLSRLADEHAASADVKSFAQMMIRDHTQANDDLGNLASKKSLDISSQVAKGQQDHVADLQAESGEPFDKDYAKIMLGAHEDAVSLFSKEASDGQDPDVVAFAKKYLPVLNMHLDHAKALKAMVQ